MNPLSKILLGIGLAVAFVILVAFVYLVIVNAHLKTQVAQAQANATACHLANDDFVAQVARQNEAVEDIKRQSAMREKQAQDAQRAAQKQAQIYGRAAAKLAAIKPGKDICVSSAALFDDYLSDKK